MVFSQVEMARVISTSIMRPESACMAAMAKFSLLVKPPRKGKPTMLSAPMVKATPAMGLRKPEPRRARNCLLLPEASARPPAARNSMALHTAWEKMWNTAAIMPASVPRPMPM